MKSTTRGNPYGFDCSTIMGNERDKHAKDERPVSLTRSILVQLPEIVAYLDRLSRYISYYLWSVLEPDLSHDRTWKKLSILEFGYRLGQA